MGTVAASVVAQRWWVEAWRHLEGDALRARALRTLGDALPRSAVWALIEGELPALGASTSGRSELSGRVALAVLLDITLQTTPAPLGPLVQVLVRRDVTLPDFALVGALARVVDQLAKGWHQVLSPGAATSSRQDLAALCDILPFDASAEGSDQTARRRQAELVLAYRTRARTLTRSGSASRRRRAGPPMTCCAPGSCASVGASSPTTCSSTWCRTARSRLCACAGRWRRVAPRSRRPTRG